MKVYKKLVRDRIPEIAAKNNQTPVIRILQKDSDYKKELGKKLLEEVEEYLSDGKIEELADIAEVILAILDFENISLKEFKKIREDKKRARGGFSDRIFLERVEENDSRKPFNF